MSELISIDRDWSRRAGITPSPELHAVRHGGVSVHIPPEADYFLWRFPFSERIAVSSIADLDRDWTYPDMLIAHGMLDSFEDALAKEREEKPR